MKTKKLPRLRLLLASVILFSCIGCDQATKTIATRTLAGSPPKSFLGDTVRLSFALNPGGFLSLGSNLPDNLRTGAFLAVNASMMLGLVALLCLKRNMPLALFLPLVFILAGGIGNLIDRVCNHGLVTDFINLGIGPLRTGVFNVADVAITFGGLAVAWLLFKHDAGKYADSADRPTCEN